MPKRKRSKLHHSGLGLNIDAEKSHEEGENICREINQINLAKEKLHVGLNHRRLGQLDKVYISITQAIELNPKLAIAHLNLGLVLRDLGQLDDALKPTKKGLELNPRFSVDAYFNLGKEMDKVRFCFISG